MKYDTQDIIYALATPWATGAIAVIRISGEGCIKALENTLVCKNKISSYPTNSAVFCRFKDNGKTVDEVVATVYKDGHGYTGQESVEISCHGGLEVVKAILAVLEKLGFRQSGRGEFTLRAFMSGKMDLTRAEAVNELINSKAQKARESAIERLSGTLFKQIKAISDTVTQVMGVLEVQLDYAEDEISEDVSFPAEEVRKAITDIDRILDTYSTGRLFSQGAKVVLAGNTNAGKSSLFNLFLKQDRSIVSSTAGTTRDYIEAQCTLDGIPITLYDTAGFRTSDCDIENEGIRRSRQVLEDAQIIIYLQDATDMTTPDKDLTEDPRTIKVINKTDANKIEKDGWLSVSAKTSAGFDKLKEEIAKHLGQGTDTEVSATVVIENERQRQLLQRAKDSLNAALCANNANLPVDLISLDIQEALEALGEITGEVSTEDILDRIFENFCVGK